MKYEKMNEALNFSLSPAIVHIEELEGSFTLDHDRTKIIERNAFTYLNVFLKELEAEIEAFIVDKVCHIILLGLKASGKTLMQAILNWQEMASAA